MNTSVTPVQRADIGALELRVLSGLHREASCPAQDGAVVGTDPDCDIVLADAGLGPRAARLRIGPNGWDIALEDGAPADEPRTPFNQALPLGPVWITVTLWSTPRSLKSTGRPTRCWTWGRPPRAVSRRRAISTRASSA